jgi:hypothetical protein
MRSTAVLLPALVLACGSAPAPADVPVVTIAAAEPPAPGVEAAEVASARPKPSATATSRAAEIQRELDEMGNVGVIGVLGGGTVGTAAPPPSVVPVSPPPNAVALVGLVSESGGHVANAAAVSAGMAAGFRRCYRKALLSDPTQAGPLTLIATIGANGEVLSVSPLSWNGLGPSVLSCASARVSAAQFAPPDRSPVRLTIPITFRVGP